MESTKTEFVTSGWTNTDFVSSGKKLLIIGGAGYLGRVLGQEAVRAGHQVLIYDSLIYEQPRMSIDSSLEVGDTRNYIHLRDTICGFKPDFVFHFGDLSSTYSCDHNPEYTEDVNYFGSINVMDICKELNIPVIYNSSSSVYSGKDNYTKFKLKMEEYVKDMKNVIVFRPATVFGLSPRFRIELLPNHFTYMAVSRGHITVSGGGNYRAAIDVDDLVSAYLRVIEVGSWKENLYDIGHFNMTKEEFAKEIQKVVPCYIKTSTKVFDTRNLQIDCSKFENEFGWKPKWSFHDSIVKVSKWIKENQEQIETSNFTGMLNMPLDMWKSICE